MSEPDKDLFNRAKRDLGRSRWTQARLLLQTLINTYPDSEFLEQSKYALAESFYREGTMAALAQAELEFKDYITFFPVSDLADDAQLMVAMTHVEQLEKPDRDRTQAEYAEFELKRMITEYPDSPLLDEAKQKLRDVQEVLAQSVFGVGNFYFIRKSYRAAADRYKEVLEKYPDFSRAPETMFSLAESLRRIDNVPESALYYARVVTEHPRSEIASTAKERLTALNVPIPEPSPAALARAEIPRDEKGLMGKMFGFLSRRPDVSTETSATSVSEEPAEVPENKDGGVFTIDGKPVAPAKPPAKKPK
jgi:outer membrane protein assembly factor BamD